MSILLYLLEASLYVGVFAAIYRGWLASLTHFHWMRGYLMLGVGLSFVLPLLPTPVLPFSWVAYEPAAEFTPIVWTWSGKTPTSTEALEVTKNNSDSGPISWLGLLLLAYGGGVVYRLWKVTQNLHKIYRMIIRHPQQRHRNYRVVVLPQASGASSFLRYVFLGTDITALTADEQRQVHAHEAVHVRQGHTYDRLLLELMGAVLWFNPLMGYLKRQLLDVHEFLADHEAGTSSSERKAYAQLLLKVAQQSRSFTLATPFSSQQIARRIQRLSQPRSLARHKLIFISTLPAVAALFLLSACLDEPAAEGIAPSEGDNDMAAKQAGPVIRNIRWQGNTVYDDETLTEELGLHVGDPYDSTDLAKRMQFSPDGPDVSALYMDRGYLYFNINVQVQAVEDGGVDILMDIHEGDAVAIGQILIRGNQDIGEDEILDQLPVKSGALFNRSQLLESQRALAAMGHFDPKQININPLPNPEQGTVDIEFVLHRQSSPYWPDSYLRPPRMLTKTKGWIAFSLKGKHGSVSHS